MSAQKFLGKLKRYEAARVEQLMKNV